MPTPRHIVRNDQPFHSWTEPVDVRLYQGDVLDRLREMSSASVQCVVTSPPYWGLRDYGTGKWEGGAPQCNHLRPPISYIGKKSTLMNDGRPKPGHVEGQKYTAGIEYYKGTCGKCGAVRIDDQLGAEPSPDCGTQGQAQCGGCFVCSMVAVFRGVRRVLRPDGTLFLNLGDTYSASARGNSPENLAKWNQKSAVTVDRVATLERQKQAGAFDKVAASGVPAGNLVGVPWRVALALQADGWVLRQDVIWHKPSPMPESVRNRCTKAHEYVFLLTKSMRYFYDAEAIKEPQSQGGGGWQSRVKAGLPKAGNYGQYAQTLSGPMEASQTRNKRAVWSIDGDPLAEWLAENAPELLERFLEESNNRGDVWRVASKGYKGAHFATFPPQLPETCIKAGTSAWGCCRACRAPYRRVTVEEKLKRERPNDFVKRTGAEGTGNVTPNTVAGVKSKTVGWEPTCRCGKGPTVPCPVLDPFLGSGTTGEVCVKLRRAFVGIELSEAYLRENAVPRIQAAVDAEC